MEGKNARQETLRQRGEGSGLSAGVRDGEKTMKKSPLVTGDGYLIIRREDEPSHDQILDAPQLHAIMRLEDTSDSLRGVLHDLTSHGELSRRCSLIGRSGHSQVGLDVALGEGEPEICTRKRTVELPVVLTSLNRHIPDTIFADLKDLAESGVRPTIGRLFIPLGLPLDHDEIDTAIAQHHLYLPDRARVMDDGTIEIPLEDKRYFLSKTLLTAGKNAQHVLLQSKEGLSLIQYVSSRGLPVKIHPRDFMVGAVKISLGPYLALIDRHFNNPAIVHLAARLLDGVRTSGIHEPRQIELYNGGEEPVDPRSLAVRVRLYPADPLAAKVAARIFIPGDAEKIIHNGVDFADVTDVFNLDVCEALFDNLSASVNERGRYARILSRNRCIEIQREAEEGDWQESIQSRVIYEVLRGNILSGERRGDQIPPDLRSFVESLEWVGGAQKLRKVYVSHRFPNTDVLRVLKRNNVGVFVGRSIGWEKEAERGRLCPEREESTTNIYFDQTTYETFCNLAGKEGARFYMIFGEGEDAHVREFYRGFWVSRGIKEKMACTHTVIAMFGSHVEGTEEVLSEQVHTFLQEMGKLPGFGGRFAVCHGSGPGLMRIADESAEDLGILRLGIGIDTEKIGQKANLRPPAMVNFKNSARHLRQNLLDRTSLCKIYNIGGIGTLEELLISITNLKLFESLPAPHIFVDPFGLGEGGAHIWESVINQFRTVTSERRIGNHPVHLAPNWVPRFCHIVNTYEESLAIIKEFVSDPLAYWRATEIPDSGLCIAYQNARANGVTIPFYIKEAMKEVMKKANMVER